MKLTYLLFIFFLLFEFVLAQSNVIKKGNTYYFADRVIVKYKDNPTSLNKKAETLFSKFDISSSSTFNEQNNSIKSDKLNRIKTLMFSAPYDPIYVIKEISQLENIEWAEPHFLYPLVYTPNDPVYSQNLNRYEHLEDINAKEAWDLNKGSDDIIIAIVDTGVEWNHEDLNANIWINTSEIENNGIDDDANGFVDDYRGWDFGGLNGIPDNDPSEDRADHGTHVAGLASAVTDNNIGIASVGFYTKIMAVKTSQDDIRDGNNALIAFGYEGIEYAANNGAHVINCSWGGYNYSYTYKAVIDYAISKGSLVVCSAGNDNSSDNFYPASYNGVLSVGATDFNDNRAGWSNYGTKIDVSSPGTSIYSTWFNNSYTFLSGTSMSAPIVAGLAGLVYNQYPNYLPLQVAEQIRSNTDNINSENPGFENQLGTGRINAFNALSNSTSKSVRITDLEFLEVGDNDGIFEAGENVKINVELTNFLNPLTNLSVTISSNNGNITFENSGGTVGSMNTLQQFETTSDFFKISINQNSEYDIDANILVSYSDGSYTDYEWITIPINPTYENHTTENISITFNSTGSIGFADYPTNLKGNGMIYKNGPNLMYEGALVYGTSLNTVVNVARDDNGGKDEDLSLVAPIILSSPGNIADKESYSKFNDEAALPNSLGIETEVYTYSYDGEQFADFVFVRYVFNNTTSEVIENFYAGQFWDYDLDGTNSDDDLVSYDLTNNFGYIFDNNGDPIETHVGLALLSSDKIGFFAMDINGTNENIISYDGFTDKEKWTALTNGLNFSSAGPSDISTLISGGPFTLDLNNKFELDFVIAAGDNLEDLTNNISTARSKYNELLTSINDDVIINNSFELKQNFPNPFNPTTVINYTIPSSNTTRKQFVSLKVYDTLGQEVSTLVSKFQNSGMYKVIFNASDLPSGIYFYQLKTTDYSSVKKMLLLK